jgi:tRNA uridine 5-carboxymethylaminomethyl modification enzyme
MRRDFDIVVIGGGHAGAEAARAAARLGARTALVTLLPQTVAQMSCNPAIGGVGKGQIVREIDALGGLMGLAADATGMQFRMLNRSKGPAVWGPRCQSDRRAYSAWVRNELAREENLTTVAGEATDLLLEAGRVVGVRVAPGPDAAGDARALEAAALDDEVRRAEQHARAVRASEELRCRAVIVTAGTFLSGLMHLGNRRWSGGRYGEPPASRLSDALRAAGIRLQRLKTGTCPRIAAESIDTARCRRQDGDEPPTPFSFLTDTLDVRQVPCWLTETNAAVHDLVRDNLHRAPLYTGQIRSTGPRYCPSFEVKVVRFPDKTSHQVFLEPEGRDTSWVYANGIPTSLPVDVQERMVRGVPGLAHARVLRWGYAIEYDYAPPTQLRPSLEAKPVRGLYLAGQVNGTTGYEEAAGQGLLAGVNAARSLAGREPLILRRDQAYIGVMIDDLVTKGVTEPYRMFTSRAEHRLLLRADNADRRLTEIGREAGLVGDPRWARYQADRRATQRAEKLLRATRIGENSLWELLRRPETTLADALSAAPAPAREHLAELRAGHGRALESLRVDARYAGYVARQQLELRRMREMEDRRLPETLDYARVPHLRHEAMEKLSAVRPRSLGQALRVSGVTPADITVLAVHLASRGQSERGTVGGVKLGKL